MKVHLIAFTTFDADYLKLITGFESDVWATDADQLAEASGRLCYKAWGRKNPATADNRGYLANIIAHRHFSVLEHASATFLIEGVSRDLLAQLTRHRHLSFSVESQRYVDQEGRDPVIHPTLRGTRWESVLNSVSEALQDIYVAVRNDLARQGVPRKQAREAARMFLFGAQPVDLVVTGNMRAWREVLEKRHHVSADREIQELAGHLLAHLQRIAPHTFQDFADAPITNEEIRRAA